MGIYKPPWGSRMEILPADLWLLSNNVGEIKMEETTDKQTWAIYNAGDSSWDTTTINLICRFWKMMISHWVCGVQI